MWRDTPCTRRSLLSPFNIPPNGVRGAALSRRPAAPGRARNRRANLHRLRSVREGVSGRSDRAWRAPRARTEDQDSRLLRFQPLALQLLRAVCGSLSHQADQSAHHERGLRARQYSRDRRFSGSTRCTTESRSRAINDRDFQRKGCRATSRSPQPRPRRIFAIVRPSCAEPAWSPLFRPCSWFR